MTAANATLLVLRVGIVLTTAGLRRHIQEGTSALQIGEDGYLLPCKLRQHPTAAKLFDDSVVRHS